MNKNSKPRIIGIVLEDIFTDFSKELIHSVNNAIPEDSNIRTIIIAGKYIKANSDPPAIVSYSTVYNSIFRFDELCDIDGLIIHLGSMSNRKKKVIRTGYSEKFRSIPKVFIASDIEGETVINYDNELGIREAIDCLVNVNGLTKLCMLGGRDDNIDARARKQIFFRCLEEYGLEFSEDNYEKTDMSDQCYSAANRLLERNPGVQAVFCVNDSVAKPLYEALHARGLEPGRDVLVFGFDNTKMAGEMIPPLSSIGAGNSSLGKKALEVLLCKLDKKEVSSESVPTRLYGRESFSYDMYDYTTLEMLHISHSFIYRMFDDCFYRYKTESFKREQVDLRRLFFEFISRMLKAMKNRYMSTENFDTIGRMIDVFFEKGAMEYTDAIKLVKCIEKLQMSMNLQQKSPAANIMVNRLFQRMKDRAIYALSEQRANANDAHYEHIKNFQEFFALISSADSNINVVFRNIDKLGLKNTVLYMYEKPIKYDLSKQIVFPETVLLKCVLREKELYLLSKERQQCNINEMFTRNELSLKCRSYGAFPIFYSDILYGVLICELNDDICDRGEFISQQLGRAIFLNNIQKEGTVTGDHCRLWQ